MSDWNGDELFASLKGATMKSIEGMKDSSDEVMFVCEDGRKFRMYHEQDCCESVALYDVAGDVDDLLGSPLLMAEVVSNNDHPTDVPKIDYTESETWTFYKLATIKGTVVLRWLGESNGYYSESVTFREVAK